MLPDEQNHHKRPEDEIHHSAEPAPGNTPPAPELTWFLPPPEEQPVASEEGRYLQDAPLLDFQQSALDSSQSAIHRSLKQDWEQPPPPIRVPSPIEWVQQGSLPPWVKLGSEDVRVIDFVTGDDAGAVALGLLAARRAGAQCPSVVCIDAREAAEAADVLRCISAFDAPLCDQSNAPAHSLEPLDELDALEILNEPAVAAATNATAHANDLPVFYQPRRVVLAPREVLGGLGEYALVYGDVSLIEAQPGSGAALDVFRASLAATYRRAFTPPAENVGPGETHHDAEAESSTARLSPSQRAEWNQLMREHHEEP